MAGWTATRAPRAPRSPDRPSYRNSGWKCVVSSGNAVHGYSATRWRQSMAMPHGRSVGGPYSSWLKKFPMRPGELHEEDARRDDVRPAPERDPVVADEVDHRERARDEAAEDAEAAVRRQDDLQGVVGVQLPLVDDVVEPAADQRRDGDDDQPVADDRRVLAEAPRLADHELVRPEQADRVGDAVPVQGERPELRTDRSGSRSGPASSRSSRPSVRGDSRPAWPRRGPILPA